MSLHSVQVKPRLAKKNIEERSLKTNLLYLVWSQLFWLNKSSCESSPRHFGYNTQK
jgi:hypothetical protein